MSVLRRLALYVGRELARHPQTRAKAAEAIAKTQQVLKNDVKPRAQQAWRDAQPELQDAKRRVTRFAAEIRNEYRKGRDGQ